MTKRILALLMSVTMIFSSVPFSPLAEYINFALEAAAQEAEGQQGLFVYFEDAGEMYLNTEKALTPVVIFNGEKVTEGVTFTWSSKNTSVATVDENGVVKAVSLGSALITVFASYNGTTASGTLNVKVKEYEYVEELIPEGSTNVSIIEKSIHTLRVRVNPADAYNKALKWESSNENIVKIVEKSSGVTEENGKFFAYVTISAENDGKATVTYTTTDQTDISGSFTVTVEPLIDSLYVQPYVVLRTTTTEVPVSYRITPSNAAIQKLSWKSGNELICTVDSLGVVRPAEARNPGVAQIIATTTDGSNISVPSLVVITDGTKSITLDKTSLSMKVGDLEEKLTASCVMNCGLEYKDAVNWSSSNMNVATVDSRGMVTAVGPGTATITASAADGSAGVKATCTINVVQPVNGVTLPGKAICWLGDTLQLSPSFIPSNASNKKVTWSSSDTSVATVSSTGLITGVKAGTAVISVKTEDGNKEAQCLVSVEIAPQSVTLSATGVTLRAGDNLLGYVKLTATVKPDDATNKEVIWSSSNTAVATVDADGKVTAVAGGTAVISCITKSGNKRAECAVTVNEDATSIRISNAPEKLFVTKTYYLGIAYNSTTVTNRDVEWSSSNPGVIEVDSKGMLTARAKGSSVIKAKYTRSDGEILWAECTVFVEDKISVTEVKLNESQKTLYTKVGSNVYLYETVKPDNASNKNVIWSTSSAAVATVTSGTVTAKAPGVAKITVTTADGGKTDYCTVYVVGEIRFPASDVKVALNTSKALTVTSSNPASMPLTWASSNTSVATVDKNGIVTALKAGKTTITATAPGGLYTASCTVTVVIPVTGVKINAETITVPKGEKRTVTATVSPSNASDQSVMWSTPSQSLPVVEVSSTGQIEGKRVGTATVTVTTNDGKYIDTLTVNVIQPVSSVGFEYSSITLDAGKKKTLSPEIRPIGATDKTVKWSSSNKKIATVDSKGVVTAVAAGTATITCSSNDGYAKGTVKVTVTQPPTGIKFSSKKTTVQIGTPKQLKVTVLPATASNKNVIWSSSDTKIAKVSETGVVTGVKKGTAKITATTANSLFKATITVNVEKPVKKITLNKTSVNIAVGKTTVVTATVSPKTATNKTVTWKSSDNDVVKVSSKGEITAKAPGYAVVTCTSADGGKTAECTVFVNQPLKSFKLNKTKLILDIDEKFTFKTKFTPSNASNKTLRWTTSNKKVVKVTSKGVLKPTGTGTATITAVSVDGGYKATCKVTVVKRVKSVSIPSTLTVYLGEKETLEAVLTPKKPSNPDVKWTTSNKKIATVKDGKITPKKTGTATITVITEDGGLKSSCQVSVKRALKSFTLNKKSVTLDTGKTFTLKVTKKPSNATESIKWTTSNKKVATVSSKGVITAVGKGTATITAKSERGITYKCKVTVKQPVTSMSISSTAATVYMGDKLTLKANVLPKNANDQSFKWSTSDSSVATVSGGTVTVKKVGTAVITVKSTNGKTASCTVTVKQHVTGIAFDRTAVSLERGEAVTLKVTVNPANASEKGYIFTSSDTKVATVSDTGVVTAVAPGTATVTVQSKENNKTATCKVTVIERVTGVELKPTAETLYVDKNNVGETLALKATVSPANATDKSVTWKSSDPSVAKVSSSGVVTAVKSGVALITVTTNDGKKTASCTITVLQHVSGIKLEKTKLTINRDESVRLNASVTPADAFNKNIRWWPENEGIATVDEYGWVTGKAVGKTTVYASTVDGDFRVSCLVTVNEPVTGVSLDKHEIEDKVYRGEKVTLTATVYPDFIEENINKDVIWSSSDESIATVKNGVVTVVGEGDVEITVTTVDGSFTDKCLIHCFNAVEKIETEKDTYYIRVGDQETIVPTVLPADATIRDIKWEVVSGNKYFERVNDEDTGKIKIIGKESGNGSIVITSVDNPAVTKVIEIRIVNRVGSVTLDKTALTINNGETATLEPTIWPADAYNKKVIYTSSDENVVTVDENGKVTAVGKGKATVTATSEDNPEAFAGCSFTVNQLVEEIVFAENEYAVGVGKTVTVETEILPANANVNENKDKLNWTSSDISVATVSDGVITGCGVGEALITAAAPDKSGVEKTVKVIVTKHAEKIDLTAETDMLWVGDSTSLTAEVKPEETTDKNVTYISSDESIATVDKNGKVTALSAGETGTATVVITARSACGSVESQCTFTVKQQITDIVAEEKLVIELGDSYSFEPTVLPENAFDKTVTYISSDEDILTVENGVIITHSTGSAQVKLVSACGKVEKICDVEIIVLPSQIEMDDNIRIEKNDTYTLTPELSPENVTQTKIVYSSDDESVASVDENGVITAHKNGTAVIKAETEKEGLFAECVVTVYVNSKEIVLDRENYEFYIGEEFTLGATVLPEDTTDKRVTFSSSDEDVVTVTADGKVKAVGKGVAAVTVTAEDTGITSVCRVQVRKHAEGISMADDAVAYVGRPLQLQAEVLPLDADNRNIIWKVSDNRAASIDKNGVFTAKERGFVFVTAETEDGSFKAVCFVEVKIGIDSVKLDKETLLLNREEAQKLTFSVLPADADDKKVKWTSSDENIVTVDNKGNVKATKTSGTAIIRATAVDNPEAYAECAVTVKTPLEGIALKKTSLGMRKGEKETLAVIYRPTDATVKDVTFISDNEEVATVDENGVVTAVAPGTAKITVTSPEGPFTDECTVKVYKEIEEIISVDLVVDRGGEPKASRVDAVPSGHDEELIFTSSDDSIASVDANGFVTGNRKGTATITVKGSISGKTHTFTVTVREPVTGVVFAKENVRVAKGSSMFLEYSLVPEDADNIESIVISSSDEQFVRIEATQPGRIEISGMRITPENQMVTLTATVTTTDGEILTGTCTVTVTNF